MSLPKFSLLKFNCVEPVHQSGKFVMFLMRFSSCKMWSRNQYSFLAAFFFFFLVSPCWEIGSWNFLLLHLFIWERWLALNFHQKASNGKGIIACHRVQSGQPCPCTWKSESSKAQSLILNESSLKSLNKGRILAGVGIQKMKIETQRWGNKSSSTSTV